MTRRLSEAERELWERLKRSVRPLVSRPPAADVGQEKGDERSPPPAAAKSLRTLKPMATPPRPPPLAGLEEKERRRLRRRLTEIDDRIDLHGMSQARAFAALGAFLKRAQARGDRIVLVVTGKGRTGEESGVLRQAAPDWLARADHRDLVSAVEEAGRRHGGAGALYVRIRRRRSGSAG